MMNKMYMKILLIVSALAIVLSFTISCTETKFKMSSSNETTEFAPPAANQFALDKETETSTIEETKAHHIYPEDFKLKPEKEFHIGDKEFLTRINFIKNHIDDFKDSDIIVEGMYALYTSWDETFKYPMVYRNGPGCCGDDQYGGFFLININMDDYETDDWIEVKGKPFLYEHTDSEGEVQKFLFLVAEEVKKKTTKERKAEMVNN